MKQEDRGAIRAENVRLVNKPLTETHSKQGSITLGGSNGVLAREIPAKPAGKSTSPKRANGQR